MLLLQAHPLPSLQGYNHHSHTAIKSPPRHGSPKLSTISSAESSAIKMPSKSSPFVDSQGEMHDPSYLNNLRLIHAEIGHSATKAHHRSPSFGSGSHYQPSRLSNLGHGLSMHDDISRKLQVVTSFDDDDDTDDDDDDDSEEYMNDKPFSRFHSNHRSYSASSATTKSGAKLSPPSASPRPSSFVTTNSEAIIASPSETKSRRSSWTTKRSGSRRSSSVTRSPPLRLLGLQSHSPEPEKNGGGDESWGFTGIVDWEREQRVAREALEAASQVEVVPHSGTVTPPPFRKLSKSLFRRRTNSSHIIRNPVHGGNVSDSTSTNSPYLPAQMSSSNYIPSHWSSDMTNSKGHSMLRQASLPSLQEQQGHNYNNMLGLRTIMSGKPLKDDDEERFAYSTPAFHHDHIATATEQQEDGDLTKDPSKHRDTKVSLHKKAGERIDTPINQELKKKMENLASGVRFGAFKAKRRLERSLQAQLS
ncbi:hypothetical protein CBS101457_000567 [Exobasidium rhododendri]|nr:hypothetical protein CBS101457_000567 [Exobasidium rhododendri]